MFYVTFQAILLDEVNARDNFTRGVRKSCTNTGTGSSRKAFDA
jgi:hypothetical protein